MLTRMLKQSKFNFSQISKMQSTQIGINSYMKDIYKYSLFSFGSLITGAHIISTSSLMLNPMLPLGAGAILSIGSVLAFSFHKPNLLKTQDFQGRDLVIAEETTYRKSLFAGLVTGGMLSISPLFAYANVLNPAIVPTAVVLSISTFAGMSLYSMSRPLGSFDKWGSVLTGAIFSVIGFQLVAAGSFWMIGPNMFSSLVWTVYPYFGIGLFSAFQIYDTQQAIICYENGRIDVLGHSLNFYLNLKNLLINFIQILSSFNKD